MSYEISRLESMRGPNFDPSQKISNLEGSIRDLQNKLVNVERLANNTVQRLDRGDYDKPPKYD